MKIALLTLAVALSMTLPAIPGAAHADGVPRPDSVSALAARATDLGVARADAPVSFAVGLDLRNKADLDAFLIRASDPASGDFQKWLVQDEFNARYGPTGDQEARVVAWLQGAGFQTQTTPNRILVQATGTAGMVPRAFGVELHDVLLDGEPHRALLTAPIFPADVSAFSTGVIGLDDLARAHPHFVSSVQPHDSVAGNCCAFSPIDLATFYDDPNAQTGSGQTIVIAGAYAWKDSDNTAFNNGFSIAQLPTGSAQVCAGSGVACSFDATNSIEVALDVEYAHGTAPAAVVKNYMAKTTAIADFTTMYNKIVTDNPGHTVSSSWGLCEVLTGASTATTDDNIIANGNALGQTWFSASGDWGAYDCGAAGLPGAPGVDFPSSSPHVMGVGGTTARCSGGMTTTTPRCTGYNQEVAWATGGGGVSTQFARPAWQTGCSIQATQPKRMVPDVALEADPNFYGNLVYFNGGWTYVGGTSDAAPQWGGYFAELNEKKGGTGLGLAGTRLYQLCGTTAYHDITLGDNGVYPATPGYDMATGVGTIEARNLLATY